MGSANETQKITGKAIKGSISLFVIGSIGSIEISFNFSVLSEKHFRYSNMGDMGPLSEFNQYQHN